VLNNDIVGGAGGGDGALRWSASPGAVGYRVFWRKAWSLDWEHERDGVATEAVFRGLSIDDFVCGVAAVGATGAESLVCVYLTPTPPATRIETQ
jgi:hypothetical protein